MPGRPQSLTKGQQEEVVSILNTRLLYYILTALAIIGGVLGVGLWQIKESVEDKMEFLVSEQFKEPQIRQTVLEAASQRAESILTTEIQPEVKSFKSSINQRNEDLEKSLKSVTYKIETSDQVIERMRSVSDFMLTVLKAQNDDRESFDQLEKWSKDLGFEFADEAGRAWIAILDGHSSPISMSGFTVPWNEGFDPSALDLEELKVQYQGAPVALRPALLEYIWKRDDLDKVRRLDFMIDVMKSDSSLKAVEYAGRYFTSGTDQRIKPLAVQHLAIWWSENRSDIVKKQAN